VDLTGSALGHSLEMTLDPANASLGQITITPSISVNGSLLYDIDNQVDIYPELSGDGVAPVAFGQIPAILAVPEPAAMTVLILPLAAMAITRRRRAGQA
jgi:hypothetical protein